MDSVDISKPLTVERCPHVDGHVSYLENILGKAPLLLVESLPGVHIVRLTNQIVSIWCVDCWRSRPTGLFGGKSS